MQVLVGISRPGAFPRETSGNNTGAAWYPCSIPPAQELFKALHDQCVLVSQNTPSIAIGRVP